MHQQRVVVTGIGVVSSIGIGWQAYWDALLAGTLGTTPVNYFDTSEFPTHIGGEVHNYQPTEFISELPHSQNLARGAQFAVAATKMAMEDADLDRSLSLDNKVGVCLGTTMADVQELETINSDWVFKGPKHTSAAQYKRYPSFSMSASIAKCFGFKGPNTMIPTACAAGNYAIGYAHDLLKLNKADVVIAGGAEPFSRTVFEGFNRIFAVSPDKCRPFDKNRKGMIPGEGAGIVVLERYEDAQARGATVYAEVLGYGTSCDATHMTIPSVNGVANVMRNALKQAGLNPEDVGYINAHGTGTAANDKTECAAIRKIFGERADSMPVSSVKSMLGHAMGAASALEAIACILSLKFGQLVPTINYENMDTECDIDCVPNKSRKFDSKVAIKNAFAFGGNNASLVLAEMNS